VSFDVSGRAVAIWYRNSGSYWIEGRSSTDGGVSWSTSRLLSNSSSAPRSLQLGFNASGRAVAIFCRDNGQNFAVESVWETLSGAMWSSQVYLSRILVAADDTQGSQLGFDASGRAIAVWSFSDGTGYIIQSRSSANGGVSWSPSWVNILSPGGDATDPQISFDDSGRAIVVWSRDNGVNTIIQSSSSTDGGVTWSLPVTMSVTGGNGINPQLSFGPSGRAIAVWSRDNGVNDIVQSSSSTDGGVTWSTPVNLSATGGDASDPQLSSDASGREIALWSRTESARVHIQAGRFGFPVLANTGVSAPNIATVLTVSAGLLTTGVLALIAVRRRSTEVHTLP